MSGELHICKNGLGDIDGFAIEDMDFSRDDAVVVDMSVDGPSYFKKVRISYVTVVKMYEYLMENHPGYPEKLY